MALQTEAKPSLQRKIAWVAMTALALLIAAYAVALLFVPGARPAFLRQRFLDIPAAAYVHLAASAVALAVGPFQLNSRLRSAHLGLHRWLGRTYVVSVFLGGGAGFSLAFVSQGGIPAHAGFGLLALLWLTTTGAAYRQIRSGDQVAHRRWIIRSYALTYAAVTLRVYLPFSQVLGLPFEGAYQTISWLCWVPNLLIAEWLILQRPVASSRGLSETMIAKLMHRPDDY